MSGIIERVLVVLDATAESAAAIDAAVRFAARSKAALHAVFVEEEDLLQVARLPVARQVVAGGGRTELTAADVELHWRAAGTRADAELRSAARPLGLELSFEIVRGAVAAAFAAASERELIVAGALARPVAGHFRVPSRALSALEQVSGPVLLAGEARPHSGGVVALLRDRGPASVRLLRAAASLAELGGRGMTLISPPALTAAPDFREWVAGQIDMTGRELGFEAAPPDPGTLHRRIVELRCQVLALAAGEADEARLREMTRGFACDLLIVP